MKTRAINRRRSLKLARIITRARIGDNTPLRYKATIRPRWTVPE